MFLFKVFFILLFILSVRCSVVYFEFNTSICGGNSELRDSGSDVSNENITNKSCSDMVDVGDFSLFEFLYDKKVGYTSSVIEKHISNSDICGFSCLFEFGSEYKFSTNEYFLKKVFYFLGKLSFDFEEQFSDYFFYKIIKNCLFLVVDEEISIEWLRGRYSCVDLSGGGLLGFSICLLGFLAKHEELFLHIQNSVFWHDFYNLFDENTKENVFSMNLTTKFLEISSLDFKNYNREIVAMMYNLRHVEALEFFGIEECTTEIFVLKKFKNLKNLSLQFEDNSKERNFDLTLISHLCDQLKYFKICNIKTFSHQNTVSFKNISHLEVTFNNLNFDFEDYSQIVFFASENLKFLKLKGISFVQDIKKLIEKSVNLETVILIGKYKFLIIQILKELFYNFSFCKEKTLIINSILLIDSEINIFEIIKAHLSNFEMEVLENILFTSEFKFESVKNKIGLETINFEDSERFIFSFISNFFDLKNMKKFFRNTLQFPPQNEFKFLLNQLTAEEDISFNNLSYTNYNLKILRIKTATRRSFTSSIIDFIRTFHMVRSIVLINFSIPDCQIDVLKEIFISRNDDLILNLVDCELLSHVLVDLICITCKNKF
ncbi:hypothetical protein CWI36_0920p0010 [Hamiltosporidium magnivora]|uniref:Uncharacterized protein n=1 Tax=Hamiltosporidium magnivora TaxID=148818 RepID=A0A4Q9L7E3_9MICR|nr:hypothetical protein CWI36_0920p0010 [Hamiltosporidium magnivora]